ncbi:unnamed protein product [Onchocerca flexuosa]|uniref:Uncharacterized protein n=1 Tax=Onchocerca flexuosa TaxID=387005 RepID=A0A183I5Z8_9BILA|nr:unnamed protein product [Onchocerca flexuosa]
MRVRVCVPPGRYLDWYFDILSPDSRVFIIYMKLDDVTSYSIVFIQYRVLGRKDRSSFLLFLLFADTVTFTISYDRLKGVI